MDECAWWACLRVANCSVSGLVVCDQFVLTCARVVAE